MKSLSSRLQRRIAHDFPQPGSAAEVVRLLAGTSNSERIQAAVVIAAKGDLREVERQAELAVVDWRDVLLNADLAHDDWPSALDAELGSDRTS